MINHKLLCLLEGKCWHEWEGGWSFPGEQHDYKCKKCGLIIPLAMLQDLHLPIPVSPDYSSPNTYIPFLQWFWKEKREMWGRFLGWVYIKEHKPALSGMWKTGIFISWLFSLTPDNEPRIMVLLSEWLALPETKEKWGWEKDACNNRLDCSDCNKDCDGTGRIKAEWAKEG